MGHKEKSRKQKFGKQKVESSVTLHPFKKAEIWEAES
jgi:hypothetical protein